MIKIRIRAEDELYREIKINNFSSWGFDTGMNLNNLTNLALYSLHNFYSDTLKWEIIEAVKGLDD